MSIYISNGKIHYNKTSSTTVPIPTVDYSEFNKLLRKPKPLEEIIFINIDNELLKLREYLLKCENK